MENIKTDNEFKDIMIDIETLSTEQNAAIISIAAVQFNKYTGEIGNEFISYINPSHWTENNRHANGNTIVWWLSQDQQLIDGMINACKDSNNNLYDSLKDLSVFIKNTNSVEEPIVWGNGSVMDISILENAYKSLKLEVPWSYWAVNDVRTIVELNPSIKENCTFEGEKHNPLNDCLHQIKYLSETIQSLNIKEH